MTLDAVLSRYWGYTSFRPLQRDAMDAILGGRDSVVVLPTGGGKSLCFQAPALVKGDARAEGAGLPHGPALVVSPLISLMKDQVDTLVENGIAAACYNSSLAADEKASVAAGIREGRYALVYVSPERLAGEGSDGFVQMLGSIAYIAIDEAHCISQWGHDFRPEYRQLGALRARYPRVALHAFTATATARVRRDIASQLALRDPVELVGSFDRPNLIYRVVPRASLKRQVQDVLDRHRGNAGIVYCTSRREVDALAAWLASTGVRAVPYHAGLEDGERHRNQDRFLNEDADVVVATVAFGMGIDRSDVRFVLHAGAPQSLEHYQQESGRAGRDGLAAECVLVYSGADFLKWRVMLERNGELTDARRALLRDMERYASGVGCRHRHLVSYFGERYAKADCGACDYCLGELEAVADAIPTARKILSCVARVGQRFGAAHVANVLCGSESEQVTRRGHQELSTFGLLRDAAVSEVRGYIEQLTAEGLLRQIDEPYPVLALTDAGVALLKDAAALPGLSLARQRRVVKDRDRRPLRPRAGGEAVTYAEQELFDRLRAVRLRIARERGVPPYVIFHDTTLRELARLKPSTVEALSGVYGIGARKAQLLGEAFVDDIRDWLAAQ
ncbi:MAG TPA: DNA helicase RecQ [Vicinamibacterales bacterium]|nr:DNA helicase RecQ [Vicinamibacterales bacterium]